jgi:uncharacterized protein
VRKKQLVHRTQQQVVIQPTPFCNIDCRYCYLPDRLNKNQISDQVLYKIFNEVFASNEITGRIHFVWHAGEPLTLPVAFYERAFAIAKEVNAQYNRDYFHGFQTNATLINDAWAEFFIAHDVKVGVSLDGPDFLHDRNRVMRSGNGTHTKVMQGIRILQKHQIDFSTICVLTNFSLDYPDEIYRFFVDHGIDYVGFNIDEQEGTNKQSSYGQDGVQERYKWFLKRFLELTNTDQGKLVVREFAWFVPLIISGDSTVFAPDNSPSTPLKLLTFDYQGNYSTFDPELAGAASDRFENFRMGNILENPLDSIIHNHVYQQVNAEIQSGVHMCEQTCKYWVICGGGFPSNKYFEHGRFDVTETIACRIYRQATADVIFDYFDNQLHHD